MKIGFSILSHKEADAVYIELINQLKRFENYSIAIHHDFDKSKLNPIIYTDENIHLVKDYVNTQWSHVNNIEALIKTFKILYDQGCDWYVTLSANCFPSKSQKELIAFLSSSNFDGYIEHNNIWTNHFYFYVYFRKAFNTKYLFKIPFISKKGSFYWKAIRRKRKTDEKIFNDNFIPYHGSDWFMINRKSMEFILSSQEKIKIMTSYFKEVNKGPDLNVCPPEVIFQTILANNPSLKLSQNNYRYIDWSNSKNWHPNVLSLNDLSKILNSDSFFVRKMDAESSLDLMKSICEQKLSS
jgi:hypothetical protein